MSNSIKGCAQVLQVNQINHDTLYEKKEKKSLFLFVQALKPIVRFNFPPIFLPSKLQN